MRSIFLVIIANLLAFCHVQAQDYREYQHLFNRIDEDLFTGDIVTATTRLDTIYTRYSFIYAKHCFKGLQIATSAGDEKLANKWLEKCFLQGVPIWMLRQNELTSKAFAYPSCRHTLEAYDSLRGIYKMHINMELKTEIEQLMKKDAKLTNRVNNGFFLFRHTVYGLHWMHNNKKSFRQIKCVAEQYSFPGERLIGLPSTLEDSVKLGPYIAQNGVEVTLQNKDAFFMLLHYYSNKRKNNLNDRMYKDVLNGYIPPYQYGRINDYMATSGKIKTDNVQRYYVQGDRPPTSTVELNIIRNNIGLNDHEHQIRNDKWEIEQRKQGTLGRTIILE
jgi:hypothetical protein